MPATAALPGDDLVVDGRRLHVVRRGEGAPAIVLLHGLRADSRLWRDVVVDLAAHRQAVAVDLLGQGRSELPSGGGLHLPDQALLLAGLLERLDLRGVTVAGHGIGGAVAVHLAAVAPDRVAALALLASPLHADVWPPAAALPLLVPGLPRLARLAGRPPGAAVLARAVDLAATEQAWRRLTAHPLPTLVLWGEQDRVLSPAYGRRLAAEMPGAAWVPVGEAGHELPLEAAERVAEELTAFAAEPPRAP